MSLWFIIILLLKEFHAPHPPPEWHFLLLWSHCITLLPKQIEANINKWDYIKLGLSTAKLPLIPAPSYLVVSSWICTLCVFVFRPYPAIFWVYFSLSAQKSLLVVLKKPHVYQLSNSSQSNARQLPKPYIISPASSLTVYQRK